MPADIPPDSPAAPQDAAASSSGASSTQAVHAVTAQREAARRSFDSQRAALLETIEKQRRTMCESAAQARRPPSAQAVGANPLHCSDEAWARLSAVCDAGDLLVMSLAQMGGVPGMSGSQEAQTQGAVAARRFLVALRAVIAEEVAKSAIAADPENLAGRDSAGADGSDQ